MALSKIKNFFGVEEEQPVESTGDDEFYTASKEAVQEGTVTNKMMLLESRAYSESQQIADYLKARNAVVVNLKRVTPDQAKRIVDFLSGTLYAIGGDLQKLGGGIFLCTEGKISDDNAKSVKGSKKEK